MTRRLILACAVAVAFAAGPSVAQTTTTCVTLSGGIISCNTPVPPPPPPQINWGAAAQPQPDYTGNVLRAYQLGRELAARRQEENDRVQEEYRRQQQAWIDRAHQEREQLVTGLIRAHKCDEAIDAALEVGDLDMAKDAKTLCVPASALATPAS